MFRRPLLATFSLVLMLATSAAPAFADHPAPALGAANAPLASGIHAGGDGAEWELITTLATGNSHTDLDFFTQGGETYMAVGTLAAGANGGGQSIFRLVDEAGEVTPEFVSAHPSAACPAAATGVLGLQHDVEATPKGEAILNTDWGKQAETGDAVLLLDATDAPGRCHDNGALGAPGSGAPAGGLEIIDISDIENPVEIGLTSHIGEAHTVNVDPKRPHIAYVVSSDSVGYGDDEERDNETSQGTRLDGFEVVDLSTCLEAARSDLSVDQKREKCRPEVYRFRYDDPEIALGHASNASIYGCHELELYPEDLLSCGGGAAAMLFDTTAAFDGRDRPRGQRLPCVRRESTSMATPTGARVTDCVTGEVKDRDGNKQAVDLRIPGWIELGAPALKGVRHLGSAHHQGRGAGDHGPAEEIDFNHETELTGSRDFLLATDERGGGVVPPDASCAVPGVQPDAGNGGIHAYAVDRLQKKHPGSAEEAWKSYARDAEGEKAIYRATPRVPGATFCTAHVFQQIPGQNRIFMGWYTQGTQVVDFIEHADGTFEWKEAGWFIPENANTWVSHVFKVEENDDGTFTYWGATGDFTISGAYGRNAVDIYKVTLPAPQMVPTAEKVACDRSKPGRSGEKDPHCQEPGGATGEIAGTTRAGGTDGDHLGVGETVDGELPSGILGLLELLRRLGFPLLFAVGMVAVPRRWRWRR